jgi:hypothetical protein
MTIQAALVAQLATSSALVDLVGVKISPAQEEQSSALPYLTYQRISSEPNHVLGGLPTLTVERWQFSAWSGSYKQAAAILAAVKTSLRGFSGVMGGTGGVTVSSCLDSGHRETFEGDSKTHHHSIDFMIYHDAV